MSIKMISCVGWVPRGVAKHEPDKAEIDESEMEELIEKHKAMKLNEKGAFSSAGDGGLGNDDESESDADFHESDVDEMDDDDNEEMKAGDKKGKKTIKTSKSMQDKGLNKQKKDSEMIEDDEGSDDSENGHAQVDMAKMSGDSRLMEELKMGDYDNEPEGVNMLIGGSSLTVFDTNKEDPYITIPDSEDEEDDEDDLIYGSDSLILVGNTIEDSHVLEIYIFEESTSNLYVHHDISLNAFPLAVQWLSANPKQQSVGNFAAVSTFLPEIEIWNLDVLNVMEPSAILGGKEEVTVTEQTMGKKKKKGAKPVEKFIAGSHEDAVMCLSWSQVLPYRLASGSADATVKLWDLSTQQCQLTMTHHKSKIQSMEFNPAEPNVLLSGSYDRSVSVVDTRNPKNASVQRVSSDIECVRWNPHQPYEFLAATESGEVTCHDVRHQNQKPLFTLAAHGEAATNLSFNAAAPTLFATSSTDNTVKLWDMSNNKPSLVASRDMKIGKVFCMNFDRSSPFTLAAGGDEGILGVWDTMENAEVEKRYRKFAPAGKVQPSGQNVNRTQRPDDEDEEGEIEQSSKNNNTNKQKKAVADMKKLPKKGDKKHKPKK